MSQRLITHEATSAAITYMAGRITIILRLVRIGVSSEIAAAAASVSRHSRKQAQIGEFDANRERRVPAASAAAAAPTNSASEAVPPNARYSNQRTAAAIGNSPIHVTRSPVMNRD